MTHAARRGSAGADSWVAGVSSAMVGSGAVVLLSGTLSGSAAWGIAGAALAAVGLGVLLAAGWLQALLLLVASLPLPAIWATDEARLSPALPVTALVVVAWLVSRAGARDHPPLRAPGRGVAAMLGALALSSLFAASPLAAARELVNFGLFLGVFLVSADLVGRRPSAARAVAWAISVAAAAAGSAAVLEAVGALPGRFPLAGAPLMRAAGGFGWPNELGMYLAVSLPFTVLVAARSRSALARASGAAAALLCGLGLAATFSRGSWLAVLIAPLALGLAGEWRLVLRLWGGLALLGLVTDLASGGALSQRVLSATGDVLLAQRLLLMAAGLLMFQAHPLVGVGPGGFGEALDSFGLQLPGLFDFVGSAHNAFIHMAAEAGIFGVAALAYFAVGTLWTLRSGARGDHLRLAYLWSFATACFVMLFEWPFAHGPGELIVLVAGVGTALAPAQGVRP